MSCAHIELHLSNLRQPDICMEEHVNPGPQHPSFSGVHWSVLKKRRRSRPVSWEGRAAAEEDKVLTEVEES